MVGKAVAIPNRWWFQPTHLKTIKIEIFSKDRAGNKTYLSCHHLATKVSQKIEMTYILIATNPEQKEKQAVKLMSK